MTSPFAEQLVFFAKPNTTASRYREILWQDVSIYSEIEAPYTSRHATGVSSGVFTAQLSHKHHDKPSNAQGTPWPVISSHCIEIMFAEEHASPNEFINALKVCSDRINRPSKNLKVKIDQWV